jgi:hypothetical protein
MIVSREPERMRREMLLNSIKINLNYHGNCPRSAYLPPWMRETAIGVVCFDIPQERFTKDG